MKFTLEEMDSYAKIIDGIDVLVPARVYKEVNEEGFSQTFALMDEIKAKIEGQVLISKKLSGVLIENSLNLETEAKYAKPGNPLIDRVNKLITKMLEIFNSSFDEAENDRMLKSLECKETALNLRRMQDNADEIRRISPAIYLPAQKKQEVNEEGFKRFLEILEEIKTYSVDQNFFSKNLCGAIMDLYFILKVESNKCMPYDPLFSAVADELVCFREIFGRYFGHLALGLLR